MKKNRKTINNLYIHFFITSSKELVNDMKPKHSSRKK